VIANVSAGTYRARHLGQGTYTLDFCVDGFCVDDFCVDDFSFHVTGTLEFVTRHGARLHGVIDATVAADLGDVPVTLNEHADIAAPCPTPPSSARPLAR
jgi:hypothetical protein